MAKKQKRANQTSMNDVVGARNHRTGEPKTHFGGIDKIAVGKRDDHSLIYQGDPDDPAVLAANEEEEISPTLIDSLTPSQEKAVKNKIITDLNDPRASESNFRPVDQSLNNSQELITLDKNIKDYNAKVLELDPLYTNLIPTEKVLVRVYVMETTRSEGGIILEPTVKVPIPTQNGMGQIGHITTPYPYQTKAVIVSAPHMMRKVEDQPYVPGTIVQLSDAPIKVRVLNKEATDVTIPSAFTHHEWQFPLPPKDMTNRHYGYLLVRKSEINVLVPANEDLKPN